jgi:transcriptional regulator GlxA family with amidase domain
MAAGEPATASRCFFLRLERRRMRGQHKSLEDERRKMAGRTGSPVDGDRLQPASTSSATNKSAFAWLREEYNRGVAVGGLCTGAHVLAQAGLLSNKRCAIHWENLPGFAEAFPQANVFADLFEIDQNIYTCAGGTAALDMMLKLIGDDFDEVSSTASASRC